MQPPYRIVHWIAQAARAVIVLVLALWLAVAAAWGVLHGFIVPRIGEWRPWIEQQASQALGIRVGIETIEARSGWLIPSFALRGVGIGPVGADGRAPLMLPEVIVAVSPRSLLRLGFEQVYLDQPSVDVRRLANGGWMVAGQRLDRTADAGDGGSLDWLVQQTEVVIRRGYIRWTDERAPDAEGPLLWSDVDVVLRASGRRHQLRVDATPPPGWGDRMGVMAQWRHPLIGRTAGDWRGWRGELHLELPRVDVGHWRRFVPAGVDISAGQGAMRLWADFAEGRVTGVLGDLAIGDVAVRLRPDLQPLALQAVQGRVGARELAGGFEWRSEDLRFRSSDGLTWPGGRLSIRHVQAPGQAQGQGEIQAERLDLAAAAQVARRLPLGTATHALLDQSSPRGDIRNLRLRWQGEPWTLPARYEVQGRVDGLQWGLFDPSASRPAIRGASVDLDANQDGGRARIALRAAAVALPGVFEDPVVPVDRLDTDARWSLRGDAIEVRLDQVKFESAHAAGEARAVWRAGSGAGRLPGHLDLQGTLSRADGRQVHRYLPLVVPTQARHYVRDAVTAGRASGVRFRLRGDLTDMPFRDPTRGEFRISAQVHDAAFSYVPRSLLARDAPPWPALTGLSGELVFDRAGMEVRNVRGRVAGAEAVQIVRADARIADLEQATVEVTGGLRGPLADALVLMRRSALSGLTAGALDDASGSGGIDAALALTLPLEDLSRSAVRGTVTLAGNDVRVTPEAPLLARARGVVTFTESGFAVTGAQARMLGGDVRFEGGTRAVPGAPGETMVQFRGQGLVTADGLRLARELGFASRLAASAQGSAAWAATLGIRRGEPELTFTSNLVGMALDLPAPMKKAAETALPVRYESALVRDSLQPGRRLADQITLEVGQIATVSYQRDIAGETPRVQRGLIAVGIPVAELPAMPMEGVAAFIRFSDVDFDAWQKALDAGPVVAPGAAQTPAPTPGARPSPPAVQAYLPHALHVRARTLRLEGRSLHDVDLTGTREGLNWRAQVEAREFAGQLDFRQALGEQAGRLRARLSRLSLAAAASADVENLLDEQPGSMPALDIVIDDFELRGKRLGRVEVEAFNRGARDGAPREWRLSRLAVTMPEATFTASGNWTALNAQSGASGAKADRRRTVLNFRLDVASSGELLKRFGLPDAVRGGKGRLEGQVGWLGSPMAMDYPSLSGQFNVSVESGQFLKADPGLAKLLGVLSLQSLPRRLALDFRDVFSEGFAFDFVRGDVRIEQGVAHTNNLQMKGVNAAVLMEGRADLLRETQDLRVVVVPEINAGTASLVATVINPAVGLGTFLAQYLLRRPLSEATTKEFLIDGTWADPRVTPVNRRPAAAADATRTESPRTEAVR